MTMFRSLFGRLRGKTAAPPPKAEMTMPPPEPVEDRHGRSDREFEELKKSASAAFMAQLKRDGYVWPSDGPSLTLEDLRERLRQARGGSRFNVPR